MLAKSEPIETVVEHTNELLIRYQQLKEYYPNLLSASHWQLLLTAVQYHDVGKAYTRFQNMILSKLGQSVPTSPCDHDIPHNYLSPIFLPLAELKSKYNWTKDEEKILIQMIAYHHDRPKSISDLTQNIKEAIEKDLQPRLAEIQQEIGLPLPPRLGNLLLGRARQQINMGDDLYLTYALLKGLLLRLDHAASAHEPIEMHQSYDIGQKVQDALHNELRPLQEFALQHRDHNIILQAQTGMGKTEAALLWIGNEKAFFTLPLRVSINALYHRVTAPEKYFYVDEENQPIAGLLHSNAMDVLLKDHLSEEEVQNQSSSEKAYQQAQLLSRKLTFTTLDQILTFPFRFKGHEKWLATLAHSKLVLDEIQAYPPEIMAVLLKALVDITRLGGKFLIMTATLPTFFVDQMHKVGLLEEAKVIQKNFTNESLRHRVELIHEPIMNQIEQIVLEGEQKRVLVICNTIAKAVEIYEACDRMGAEVYLLHSQFTLRDRARLEQAILDFALNDGERSKRTGIWITTQIVEASLDVDFDLLYTEMAVLDSLFQRMGRVYRSRHLEAKDSNVRICTIDCSGIGHKSVYDPELVGLGLQAIQLVEGQLLSESMKMELINEVYDVKKVKDTKYYQTFVQAFRQLDTQYDLTRSEAQRLFRDIQSISVIPRTLFDHIGDLFNQYEEATSQYKKAYRNKDKKQIQLLRLQRRQIRREIEQYSVPISFFKVRDSLSRVPYKGFEHLYICDCQYEFDKDTLRGKGVYFGEPDLFW